MIPKRAKDYIAQQALKEGIPDKDLQDMVNGYWREVNMSMEELRHIKVRVHGMGTFYAMYGRINDRIEKEVHTRTKGRVARRHKVARIMKLKRLKDGWDEEYLYGKQVRDLKREYRETGIKPDKDEVGTFTGKLTEGMGAQRADSGGVLQQVSVTKQRYKRNLKPKKGDM